MELPAVDGGVVLSIGRAVWGYLRQILEYGVIYREDTVELPEADTGVWCYL